MWDKIKDFFKQAWEWIKAMWEKHDELIGEMVGNLLPMVIAMAFRNDLTGEQKKKVIVDAVLDNAEIAADEISTSLLNEAIEVAAARYNIHIGKLTKEKMDKAADAARKAGRDFANNKLDLTGTEAEDEGFGSTPTITVEVADVE